MSSLLKKQQQQFAQAIRNHAQPPTELLQLTPQGKPARFHVYSNGYQIRLSEALKENYPVLARVLGDQGFAELAADFLLHSPSSQPSIRWFGGNLANFVQQQATTLPHPSLLDLIRMEWALSTAFDARDKETLQVSDFMHLTPQDWPALKLVLHPSVRVLEMAWNVEPLWSALNSDDDAKTEAPSQQEHHLLVWRYQQINHWRSVNAIEAQLLNAVADDASFTDLCVLAAESDTAADAVATYLRVWVEAGLVSGMSATQ